MIRARASSPLPPDWHVTYIIYALVDCYYDERVRKYLLTGVVVSFRCYYFYHFCRLYK